MSEQKYELAFYGELVAGSSLDETKQLVAQLFKTNVEQIERMFTGNRVVIRNKLDQSTALKYIEALKKRGAKCQIELMGSPGEAVDLNKPEPSPAEPEPAAFKPAAAPPEQPQHQPDAPKPASPKATMSLNGLPIAGEKVDEILSSAQFDLAPVGVRLEDEKKVVAPELPGLDNIDLAPAGSDLLEKKDTPPVAAPDTSHIQMAPKE